jgi:hypothetical protein
VVLLLVLPSRLKGLNTEEVLVYQVIKEYGNTGVEQGLLHDIGAGRICLVVINAHHTIPH